MILIPPPRHAKASGEDRPRDKRHGERAINFANRNTHHSDGAGVPRAGWEMAARHLSEITGRPRRPKPTKERLVGGMEPLVGAPFEGKK